MSLTKKTQLLYLIIQYGPYDDLNVLLQSLNAQVNLENTLVLIIDNNALNNASRKDIQLDESKISKSIDAPSAFANGMSMVHLLSPENLGYFGAAQWGYKEYLRANENQIPDWVMVSNTDLKIESLNLKEQLSSFQNFPNLGGLAPLIISELSGQAQNPYMQNRPKDSQMHFLAQVFANDFSNWSYQWASYLKSQIKKSLLPRKTIPSYAKQKIYAAHGAFMILHHNYFKVGHDFSHPIFLFGEEISVAENIRNSNLEIWFEPKIRILHREHQSTGIIPNKKMRGYIKEASAFCAKKYFSATP